MRFQLVESMALFSHHLGGFGPGYGKLHVGIFLPVAKEQRKFGEETIIYVSDRGNRL